LACKSGNNHDSGWEEEEEAVELMAIMNGQTSELAFLGEVVDGSDKANDNHTNQNGNALNPCRIVLFRLLAICCANVRRFDQ
jgi:hypothetical protein